MRRYVRKDDDDAVSDFFLIAKVLRNWQFTVVELEVALIGRLDVAYGPRSTYGQLFNDSNASEPKLQQGFFRCRRPRDQLSIPRGIIGNTPGRPADVDTINHEAPTTTSSVLSTSFGWRDGKLALAGARR